MSERKMAMKWRYSRGVTEPECRYLRETNGIYQEILGKNVPMERRGVTPSINAYIHFEEQYTNFIHGIVHANAMYHLTRYHQ